MHEPLLAVKMLAYGGQQSSQESSSRTTTLWLASCATWRRTSDVEAPIAQFSHGLGQKMLCSFSTPRPGQAFAEKRLCGTRESAVPM